MKKTLKAIIAVLALAGICASANAALYLDVQGVWIDMPPPTLQAGTTPATFVGNPPYVEDYKFESTNPGFGQFGTSYNTTKGTILWFGKTYEAWTVSWNGGPKQATDVIFSAKAGNNSWSWDLTSSPAFWDGAEDLIVVNNLSPIPGTVPNFNGLSHIEFQGTPVPEPSTVIAGALLLLPFGVSTLRMLRRKTS